MTEISLKKKLNVEVKVKGNIYDYGAYYDEAGIHKKEDNWTGILIYVNPKIEGIRTISSLEGHFVSQHSLLNDFKETSSIGNPIISRKDMEKFEKKYQGKFIPFEK